MCVYFPSIKPIYFAGFAGRIRDDGAVSIRVDLFGFSIVNIVKKLLGKNVTDKGGSSSNPLDQLDTAAASRLSVSVCMMADVDGDGKDDDADDSTSLSLLFVTVSMVARINVQISRSNISPISGWRRY